MPKKRTFKEFVKMASQLHGNKYKYDEESFNEKGEKIKIICPIHGEFEQVPSFHLNGQGCPKCKTSHLENEIMTLLEENNIDYIYISIRTNGLKHNLWTSIYQNITLQ